MQLIIWNINSLNKRVHEVNKLLVEFNPDILCLTETKTHKQFGFDGYYSFVEPAVKGRAGVMVLSKQPFEKLQVPDFGKGRIVLLRRNKLAFVFVYAKNAGVKLKALKERMEWDKQFFKFVSQMEHPPILIAGDLNVVSYAIDIHDNLKDKKKAGCSDEERSNFHHFLQTLHYKDVFRELNPLKHGFTYWSYRYKKGWRLDYILVKSEHKTNVKSCCPLEI